MQQQQTTTQAIEAGDLIFVRASDWVGRFVARATSGPYSHVRVAISPSEVIEAMPQGILRSPLGDDSDPADVAHLSQFTPFLRRQGALTWLMRQVGRPYGFLDIAADALGILTPRWLGSRTPFLVAPSQYDCSHIAAIVAVGMDYPLPLAVIADLPRVSPNSLARAVGILK